MLVSKVSDCSEDVLEENYSDVYLFADGGENKRSLRGTKAGKLVEDEEVISEERYLVVFPILKSMIRYWLFTLFVYFF